MKRQRIYPILRRLADKTLPASQRNTVLRWLADTPDMSEKEEALFKLWNETDTTAITETEAQNALQTVKDKLQIEDTQLSTTILLRRHPWTRTLLRYAAIMLLPLVTGLIVWGIMQDRIEESSDMIECFVPQGQQQTLQLPDGSRVTLNSGTLFIYPKHFHGNNRKVHLSGEAYFQVSHDADMPFLIGSGPLTIKVVGTTFNVNAYPEDESITTTLEEGCVKVFRNTDSETHSIVMQPNERLVYHHKNGQFELYKTEAKESSSWTTNNLVFQQQPLSAILKTLERRYNVAIRCDEGLELSDQYTIKFNHQESLEEVMRILTFIIGNADYRIQGSNVTLTGKKGGHRK